MLNKGTQILTLEGLRFDANLGILEHEINNPQPIQVDAAGAPCLRINEGRIPGRQHRRLEYVSMLLVRGAKRKIDQHAAVIDGPRNDLALARAP